MRLTDRIAARPLPASEGRGPRSELLMDGQPTGKEVDGAVLEAAVDTGDGYLLFLTDDTPFEDALSIHLIDRSLSLIDSARLGSPYSTGTFSGLDIRGDRRLSFRFFGDTDWTVELLDRPAARVPFWPEARGVSRPFGFSRRFRVEGSPKPA